LAGCCRPKAAQYNAKPLLAGSGDDRLSCKLWQRVKTA